MKVLIIILVGVNHNLGSVPGVLGFVQEGIKELSLFHVLYSCSLKHSHFKLASFEN